MRHSKLVAGLLLGALSAVGCNKPTPHGGTSTNRASQEAEFVDVQPIVIQPIQEGNASADAKPEIARTSEVDLPPKEVTDVEVISFDDLNIGMQVDAKFRPLMLDYNDGRVKDLFGKRVNVAGYMNPTDEMRGVKQFILLRNLECKFGPGGQADHLVNILLQGKLTTDFTDQVVYVEGELELDPFPDDTPSTYSIYTLKATKVSTKAPPRSR